MTTSTSSTGVVKSINERGFAFLENQIGESVFAHRSSIVGSPWESLHVGDSVSFEQTTTDRGFRAENLRITATASSK